MAAGPRQTRQVTSATLAPEDARPAGAADVSTARRPQHGYPPGKGRGRAGLASVAS